MFRSFTGRFHQTILALVCCLVAGPLSAQDSLDVVISGGRVVDGTGAPWYRADIGIRDGMIVRIGRIPAAEAKHVIDAKGLVVAPGFVDMMGQTATPLIDDPKSAFNLLSQGITTINSGEGESAAPLSQSADLVVFDFEELQDVATFAEPDAPSVGVVHVLVNGQQVLKDGKMTNALPGRVLRGPGYQPSKAPDNINSGKDDPRFEHVNLLMHGFMREHHVPGASIALTRAGRLAMARGYGYADVAAEQSVQPSSLFRIASISKPITAVAILQLVEQEKLDLDAKLFSVLDYEKEIAAAGDKFDARLRQVTIRQVLQHRGGWDRGKSFDPMFQSVRFARQLSVDPPADQQAVIRAMLTQSLDFDPGRRYAYSNFGYCLLGRVIERASGEPYERFVKQHVLAPLGITDMKLGATRLAERQPNEVRYYHPETGTSVFQDDLDREVPWPYGAFYLEAMDSHGAWLASATDLATFASAFDRPGECKILSRKSIELMYERPPGLAGHDAAGKPKDVYYSLGWFNRVVGKDRVNHWHTGSLPGTAAVLIRRWDGCNMVALLNTRVSPTAKHLGRVIDPLLHQAADIVVADTADTASHNVPWHGRLAILGRLRPAWPR